MKEKKMRAIVSILDKSESVFLCMVVTKYFLFEPPAPISVTVNVAFWQRNPTVTLKLVCVVEEGRESW